MLRITPSASAEAAKEYFHRGLSRGEYYQEEHIHSQEIAGHWGGRGAEFLGMTGPVNREAFDRLCDNRHPATGKKLTVRDAANRRVGYDLNFHVPKSVSVALELTGDRQIIEAFRESVAETMRELETEMATRVRKDGENGQRTTGNMVWAEFVHFTARPVDGIPDPHLHSHCFAFNATFDHEENRWKAGEFGDIKRDAPYYQAAFHTRLAVRLRELGYEIERRSTRDANTRAGWEIAGVPNSVIKAYSRRSEEIETLAREQDITDPAKKAEIGARSRKKKLATASMEELRKEWHDRLSDNDAAALATLGNGVVASRGTRTGNEQHISVNGEHALTTALHFAQADLFVNESVVSEKRLLAAALEHCVGEVTPESMQEHVDRHVGSGTVLRKEWGGQMMVTTPEVYQEEQKMLATVREGRGQVAPLKAEHEIADKELSNEQRHAATHILSSIDTVIMLRGQAGVGKTRVMKEVVAAIEAEGTKVQAAAPRSMTTQEVLREDGFEDAKTVAHVLANESLQEKLKGQVLWVDEAGQLSMPEMQKLVELAKEKDIRLLLTGDTRQHRSVKRGDSLRLLETESGLPVAELTEVRRQRHADYREAAQALASGDLIAGFETLNRMGAIREIGDEDRAMAAAATYVDAVARKRATLVVSPTHAEGRAVTAAIREKLREEGRVASGETSVARLIPRYLSDAKKSEATRYEKGDVVQFQQHAGDGHKRGDRGEVVSVEKGVVTIKRERTGELASLPLHKPSRFEVYEKSSLNLSAGDRIRITRNGHCENGQHRLSNGAIYAIKSIDDAGNMTLANGWTVRSGYGHIDHGYVVTSDAAQGRTVDHLILVQSYGGSLQQFYTSVTRGRFEISVITDDTASLLKAAARDTSRLTATEFWKESMLPPRERGMHQRRAIGRWLQQQYRSGRLKRPGERERDQSRNRNDRSTNRSDRNRDRNKDRGRDRGRDQGGLSRER